MKIFVLAVVLGALSYFVFIYEPQEIKVKKEPLETENQKLEEEYGDETSSYSGAITETYNKLKKGIDDAKNAVLKIEERNQEI